MEGKKGETEESRAGGRGGKSGWRGGDGGVRMSLWNREETEWGDKEEAS